MSAVRAWWVLLVVWWVAFIVRGLFSVQRTTYNAAPQEHYWYNSKASTLLCVQDSVNLQKPFYCQWNESHLILIQRRLTNLTSPPHSSLQQSLTLPLHFSNFTNNLCPSCVNNSFASPSAGNALQSWSPLVGSEPAAKLWKRVRFANSSKSISRVPLTCSVLLVWRSIRGTTSGMISRSWIARLERDEF
jgi:hypothetical protein